MEKSEPPVWLELNDSFYLLIFIVSIHILAILSCLMVTTFLLKYPLLVATTVSLYVHMRRYRRGVYLFTLKYTPAFAWELREGQTFSAIRILNSSVLSSFVCVLHVQMQSGCSRSLLIFRDAVSVESYRQLRVALKINAVQLNK